MRSHGLRQLVDDKFLSSCQKTLLQVDYSNLLSADLLQVVSTSCNKSANRELKMRCFCQHGRLPEVNHAVVDDDNRS